MKAIITLSIVLLFGVVAQAQSEDLKNLGPKKAEMLKVISSAVKSYAAIKCDAESYVLLSKFKNTRIKKALRFDTRNNKAKMA